MSANNDSTSIAEQRFGRLIAVLRLPDAKRMWQCQCDCGNKKNVRQDHLKTGKIRSCGCLQSEVAAAKQLVHGQCRKRRVTKAFRIWSNMLKRCNDQNDAAYERYGARGIKVCERWLKFENFFSDMGNPPTGMSLDRINNNLEYYPINCRWASAIQQGRNKRNNVLVTFLGETHCVTEWSEISGINSWTIRSRIRAKMPPEKILREIACQDWAQSVSR